MNDTQKALLEKGVVVMPEYLDHETYEYVLEATLTRRERIVLYCRGNGGDSRAAIAIVDLIQQHGDVIGFLPGEANSSHVPIFAGCKERYVFPNGVIGLHKLGLNSYDSRIDSQTMRLVAEEYERAEQRIADILAVASGRYADWWLRVIKETGSAGVTQFDAAEMIEMGMARPVAEFKPLTPNPSPTSGEGSDELPSGGLVARTVHVHLDDGTSIIDAVKHLMPDNKASVG